MKLWFKWLTVGAVLLVGVGVVYSALAYRPVNVRVGDGEFRAKIVRSAADRERGLSGTSQLGDQQAMLFVFPSDDRWGIWMKDMNYPIDIVWLDGDKTVRHIVTDARPDSYPTVFRPDGPMRYVIELKSGTVKHKSITIGTRAEFSS